MACSAARDPPKQRILRGRWLRSRLEDLRDFRHSKEPEDEGILDETLHVSVLGREFFWPNERAWSSHWCPHRHSAALAALPEVRSGAEASPDSCRGRRCRNHRKDRSGTG